MVVVVVVVVGLVGGVNQIGMVCLCPDERGSPLSIGVISGECFKGRIQFYSVKVKIVPFDSRGDAVPMFEHTRGGYGQ